MIGNYPFKNYEGFKELFVREDGRRKNAVLLAWYKSKEMRTWLIERAKKVEENYGDGHRYLKGFSIRDMSTLKEFCLWMLRANCDYEMPNCSDRILFPNLGWYASNLYHTDERNGLCFDRDYRAYRYRRLDTGRDFKMKAGRLFGHCIDCTTVRDALPYAVRLWLCEEIQRDWEMYTRREMPDPEGLELHVDDDFAKIYNSRHLRGNFGSCMVNRDLHCFYENAVKAKAAYLTDEDGLIKARCVIFEEVEDINTGEVVRLAERQYSTDGFGVLNQDLINALIKGNHIDGYKINGAGCSDTTAFKSVSGESWSERHFRIKCNLGLQDEVSYQDSFKYYDLDGNFAYNWGGDCPTYDRYNLGTTEGSLGGGNYDEYHDEYTSCDLVSVYYGRWMDCSEDCLDDFEYIEGTGYVHYDYCTRCEECDEYFMGGDGYLSEITGESYCCESCREDAERRYKEENWAYSSYDDEYFEDDDDVTSYVDEYGDNTSISVDSVESLVDRGKVIKVGGKYYSAGWAAKILEENS